MNDEYVLLDTRAFTAAIGMKDSLISDYNALNTEYDRIVSTLLQNWKGRGADAFANDARTVKTNIVGIYEILRLMCDMLQDCLETFRECDSALETYNRNPDT